MVNLDSLQALGKTIRQQMILEDELAWASERAEIMELFDKAREKGTDYAAAYMEGFSTGYVFVERMVYLRHESSRKKLLAILESQENSAGEGVG